MGIENKYTLMMSIAVDVGDISLIESVLASAGKHGMDVNSMRDGNGRQPLYWACENGSLSVVKFLVNIGADVNGTNKICYSCLHAASNNYDISDFLISSGASIDAQDEHGHTPFMRSVESENLRVAELFIKRGANINHAGINGWTALTEASYRANCEMISFLLQKGADFNIKVDNQRAPIWFAARSKLPYESVKILIDHGASSDDIADDDEPVSDELIEFAKKAEESRILRESATKNKPAGRKVGHPSPEL